MLKQLSIYAENKKGALQTMTNALYEAGINIWGPLPTTVRSTASTVWLYPILTRQKRSSHREGLPLPFRGCSG